MKKILFITLLLVALLVAASGCTGTKTPTTTATTTATGGTQSQQTSAVVTLTTGPLDTMPSNQLVTVDVGQKEYNGEITVTFQGGYGQSSTSKVVAKLTRIDGTTDTKTIGTNKGDSVTFSGTRGTGFLEGQGDRIEVSVTMNNGKTYKIVDVIREYRSRA